MNKERRDQEMQCIKTITTCLDCYARRSNMVGHTEAVSSSEVMELLDLLISLLASDTTPSRLCTLLFESGAGIDYSFTQDVLGVLLAVIQRAIQSPEVDVAHLAIQTLSKALSLCSSEVIVPDIASSRGSTSLAQRAFRSFTTTRGTNLLVDILTRTGTSERVTAYRIAAAECLFVYVMRLEEGCSDVASNHIRTLISIVVSEKTEMIRNYICAVLRVVSEKHTDCFVDVNIFVQIAKVLVVETSKYVQVLLLELCFAVVSQFHFFFLTKVLNEISFLQAFGPLTKTVLGDDTVPDVQEIMCRLIAKICEMEMTMTKTPTSFASTCLELELWKPMLMVNQASALSKLTALRWVISACSTHHTVEMLRRAMPNIFPSFVLILNSNQTTPNLLIDAELVLILGIALTKHPSIRVYVRDTLMQYPVWCEQLRVRMRLLVTGLAHDLLSSFDIVDFRGTLLNDPEDIPGVAHASHLDFENATVLEGVACGVLQQQAFSPVACTLSPKVPSDSGRRMKAALTQALLCAAINITMQDDTNSSMTPQGTPQQRLNPLGGMQPGQDITPPIPAPAVRHRQILTPVYPYEAAPGITPLKEQQVVPIRRLMSGTPKIDKQKQWMMHGKGIFGQRADASPGPRTPFKPASSCRTLFSDPTHSQRTDFTRVSASKLPRGIATQDPRPGLLNPSSSEADYIDVAILMHLPITFGAHYNRIMREPTCRILEGPNGPVVQTLHKSTNQLTWTIQDVISRDLFRFFIPFHKLTVLRVNEELENLRRHTLRTKKELLVTPSTKRTRRWFLHDLMNYILPKTEGILLELKDALTTKGEENFVFALGMVRLLDQGNPDSSTGPERGLVHVDEDLERYRQDMVLQQVLRLSVGRYKDVLHCGNIIYALERVKRYFNEQNAKSQGDAQNRPQHLTDIENEIKELERKALADQWDNDNAEDMDDVEDEHQESEDEDEKRYNGEMERLRRTPDPDAAMTDFGEDLKLAIPKALLREANMLDGTDNRMMFPMGGGRGYEL